MESESSFDCEQTAIRLNQSIAASDQLKAEARDKAMQVELTKDLFERWWSFVQAGKKHRLQKGDEEGYPEKLKPTFQVWKVRIEKLSEDNPVDFLQKIQFWNMGRSEYSALMDRIIHQVSGEIFDDLGNEFFDDESEDWKR